MSNILECKKAGRKSQIKGFWKSYLMETPSFETMSKTHNNSLSCFLHASCQVYTQNPLVLKYKQNTIDKYGFDSPLNQCCHQNALNPNILKFKGLAFTNTETRCKHFLLKVGKPNMLYEFWNRWVSKLHPIVTFSMKLHASNASLNYQYFYLR